MRKREIKFRAWDSIKKRFATYFDTVYISDEGSCSTLKTTNFNGDHLCNEDFEINMFVGLKDKNDKEIYEGDIIKHNDNNFICAYCLPFGFHFIAINKNIGTFLNDQIVMTNHNCRSYNDIYRIQKYCLIIGNIYENPELLK